MKTRQLWKSTQTYFLFLQSCTWCFFHQSLSVLWFFMMENSSGRGTPANLASLSPCHVRDECHQVPEELHVWMQMELEGKCEWFPVSVWIKLLPKWEGDSVLKQLSPTLWGSAGFCVKTCKYKSHAGSCSSDYTDPLSSALQYRQPTPRVMGEIYHRFI